MSNATAEISPEVKVEDAGPACKRITVTVPAKAVDARLETSFGNLANAAQLPGFSGAELANLVNVAAIRAAVLGGDVIDSALLDWARDRVLMGSERRSALLSQESRKLTAYHEGGHAIVALRTPAAMPLRFTIPPWVI